MTRAPHDDVNSIYLVADEPHNKDVWSLETQPLFCVTILMIDAIKHMAIAQPICTLKRIILYVSE